MNNYQSDKEWFIKNLNNKNLVNKIKIIKIIITDIDGCLTGGTLLYSSLISTFYNKISNIFGFTTTVYDKLSKEFSVQDGYAITQSNKKKLIKIAFLTGRTDIATKIRAKALGIPKNLCFTGIDKKKIEKVKLIQKQNNFTKEEILYFGDDFLDYETLDATGIMCSPQNTPFYFQDKADLIIPRKGGNGAFRLLLDFVLYVQQKHFAQNFIDRAIK